MRAAPFLLSVWPGLARLWLRGQWSGLATAVLFGAVVQIALVTTFVWPELIVRDAPPWLTPTVAWFLVVSFWIAGLRSALRLRQEMLREALGDSAAVEPLLREAQREYLKGHWLEAESLVKQMLVQRPVDVEGRLLLATLYRRTQRYDEASRQLDRLTQLPAAVRWVEEIEDEMRRLKQTAAPSGMAAKAA